MNKSKKAVERFWDRVHKGGRDDCWPWTGWKDRDGYGALSVSGRFTRAHRFSYRLHFGDIPEGMLILHDCDNPSCVNPRHLIIGSNLDNMQDKERKGRGRRVHGEQHVNAKLTTKMVLEIRRLYATGRYTQYQLAAQFRVNQPRISKIVNQLIWKRVQQSTERRA